VRTDPPDEDAYGRVTNPERFQAVADAHTALVDELVDTFDVEATVGNSAVDFPNWPDGSAEPTQLAARPCRWQLFQIKIFVVSKVHCMERQVGELHVQPHANWSAVKIRRKHWEFLGIAGPMQVSTD